MFTVLLLFYSFAQSFLFLSFFLPDCSLSVHVLTLFACSSLLLFFIFLAIQFGSLYPSPNQTPRSELLIDIVYSLVPFSSHFNPSLLHGVRQKPRWMM